MYAGSHTDRDPGAGSPDLLASYKMVDKRPSAELKSKELIKSAKQVKSADAIANDANLEALQVIRLQEEIMARPDQPFYLEQASTQRNVDMLESRETWRSIGNSVQRKGRAEETKEKITKYAEIRYDVTKLAGKTWTPIEDKMRTIRDPEAIDLENLDWEFAYTRNEELKEVIESITDRKSNGTTGTDGLGDISLIDPSGHSNKNVANELSKFIKTFRTKNRLPVDVALLSVEGFDKWMANTWTGSKAGPFEIEVKHFPNGGVTELPGFPGITAIIEPELTDSSKILLLNKTNALRTVQGPTLYRRSYDEDKDAEIVKILDFVQFLSVDETIDHKKIGDRYFNFTASYTG